MADTAAAPATDAKSKNVVVKPDKPDEDTFKTGEADLKKAHQVKKDALVSQSWLLGFAYVCANYECNRMRSKPSLILRNQRRVHRSTRGGKISYRS
jgi:hypothetical protein